jgi:hypothetical protein
MMISERSSAKTTWISLLLILKSKAYLTFFHFLRYTRGCPRGRDLSGAFSGPNGKANGLNFWLPSRKLLKC